MRSASRHRVASFFLGPQVQKYSQDARRCWRQSDAIARALAFSDLCSGMGARGDSGLTLLFAYIQLPVSNRAWWEGSLQTDVTWFPVSGVEYQAAVQTPGKEFFLAAFRQMMPWSASLPQNLQWKKGRESPDFRGHVTTNMGCGRTTTWRDEEQMSPLSPLYKILSYYVGTCS